MVIYLSINKGHKPDDHLNRHTKSIWQNLTSIHKKAKQKQNKTTNKEQKFPQPDKGHL